MRDSRQNWGVEADGSVRIAWTAEGYVAIHVYARFWPQSQLGDYASAVADAALINRTVADLRRALRREFGGALEIEAPDADAPDQRVAVRFNPPRGVPNPDPLIDL